MSLILDALNRACGGAFEPNGDPRERRRLLSVAVASLAFAALMLELLLARMFPFFLGNASSFMAIPVAMFGLSVGALVLHWLPSEPRPRWIPLLMLAQLGCTFVALSAVYWLFNEHFEFTHNRFQNPIADAKKTAVMALAFVPSFALTGIVLSTAFSAASDAVGRLYALDLAGSALACLAVPLLLHGMDMPLVLSSLLAVLALAVLYVFSARRLLVGALLIPALVGLFWLAGDQLIFTARPAPEELGSRIAKGRQMEVLSHEWNDISRVTLMEFWFPGRDGRRAARSRSVIHDDGISNVGVQSYDPRRVKRPPKIRSSTQGLAFLLDEKPRTALVLFAGSGRDMLRIHQFARGRVDVTGVELNGLVKELVTADPYDPYRLQEFYDLDEIHWIAEEGRAFLNRDPRRYDLIYVGSNGAQQVGRTGHSRKYLETREAMDAYLDHLAPGGSLVFARQEVRHKIEILKRLFRERGYPPLSESGAFFGPTSRNPMARPLESMIIRPAGFSEGEIERIRRNNDERERDWCKYAPGFSPKGGEAKRIKAPPALDQRVPTDDQPFTHSLRWSNFQLQPDPKLFEASLTYALDWSKIFTLGFFGILSLLSIGAFYLRRREGLRLPAWLALWFLGTGVCYMFAQIGLMAKLELFMGNPLYSIAVVLASFLLFNGAGSHWMGLRQERGALPEPWRLAALAALAVLGTVLIVDGVLAHLLALPLVIKALLVLATVAPLAFVLGTFYPLGVAMAVERGYEPLVPMTFGLATLSSVLGSTYAMVMVINLGFRLVILHGLVGYLLIAGIAALARRRAAVG